MLLTSLISMACSNINTWQNHQDACNSFITESTQKVGLYQGDQATESYLTTQATNTVTSNVGKTPIDVAAGTVYVYRVYKNRAIDFKLPTMGVCDGASNSITTNTYTLNLTWKLPWK